jgi:hypothetical protein
MTGRVLRDEADSLNAHAQDLMRPTAQNAAGRSHSEHISLESEPELAAAPTRPARHKIRSTYTLKSRLRGCVNEISILEDHFLSVHTIRPDREPVKYVFDLRFVNAKPVRVRSVSWLWLAMTVVIGLAAAGAFWYAASALAFSMTSIGSLGGCAAVLAGLATFLLFLRGTTESLQFTSVHGNAILLSITGGIGSARAGKNFFVELIKNINAAKAARQQAKPQWLRDEMREHHRLRELGVLSEAQYEASKARILAAHA